MVLCDECGTGSDTVTKQFFASARNGHIECIFESISQIQDIDVADEQGKTALVVATEHRQKEVAFLLRQFGANARAIVEIWDASTFYFLRNGSAEGRVFLQQVGKDCSLFPYYTECKSALLEVLGENIMHNAALFATDHDAVYASRDSFPFETLCLTTEHGNDYFPPLGWVKFGLNTLVTSGREFRGSGTLYHGCSIETAKLILEQKSPSLLSREHSTVVKCPPGHIPSAAIWLSPTILYSGCTVYAHAKRLSNGKWIQIAFQVRCDLEKFDNTSGSTNEYGKYLLTTVWPRDLRIEPGIPDNVVEFWTRHARELQLVGLLVRVLDDPRKFDSDLLEQRKENKIHAVEPRCEIQLPTEFGVEDSPFGVGHPELQELMNRFGLMAAAIILDKKIVAQNTNCGTYVIQEKEVPSFLGRSRRASLFLTLNQVKYFMSPTGELAAVGKNHRLMMTDYRIKIDEQERVVTVFGLYELSCDWEGFVSNLKVKFDGAFLQTLGNK